MKQYFNQTKQLNKFTNNFLLINKYVIQYDEINSNLVCEAFTSKVQQRCKTRGTIDTIKWIKDLRVCIYAYLGKYKVAIRHLSTTKDGIPTVFPLEIRQRLREGDIKTIRFLLTLLQVSRFLEGQKDPDFSPITDPATYLKEIHHEFSSKCARAITELGLKPIGRPKWKVPHFTSKGSPSGPAMLSAKHDLEHLPESLINSIRIVGGDALHDYMTALKLKPETFKQFRDPKPAKVGRLRSHGLVEDTEAKTRVIAMADYWTQTSLKELHNELLGSLRTLGDKDLTFGQDIRPFGQDDQMYYSFDLTSATDRLPRFLYVEVLKNLVDEEYAIHWESALVDYGFHGPDGIIRNYGTGQPMGLYSSWPLLAIVHHCIVQVAALRVGLRRFKDYRILGDDIVIRNNKVAVQYQEILKSLGVGLSPEKSLVSQDTFEFAKRLFFRGTEVTAFPLHGIHSAARKSWQDLYSVIETASKRNFGTLLSLVEPRLTERILYTNGLPRRLSKVASKYMKTFYILSTATRPHSLFLEVCDFWKLNVGCNTDTKLVLHEVTNRYLVELTSELQSAYFKTIDQLEKYYELEEWQVDDILYDMNDYLRENLPEPLSWCMLDQAYRIKHVDLHPAPDPEDTLHLDKWAEALRKANVRILDPKIFDRSRAFERISRLKSSCATKAFAREAQQLFKLLPQAKRADKAR